MSEHVFAIYWVIGCEISKVKMKSNISKSDRHHLLMQSGISGFGDNCKLKGRRNNDGWNSIRRVKINVNQLYNGLPPLISD